MIALEGHHQPKLRTLKWLMYLSLVITILYLTLLHWVNRSTYPAQNQRTVPPESVPQQPEKVPLVAVNGTHTLLLSAYMEHRTLRQEVRVIAVAQRKEAVAYRCIFSCQEIQWEWKNEPTILKLSVPPKQHRISVGESSFHPHFGFEYGTVDILCPLPMGCGAPSHVAVTSAGENVTVEEQQPVFLEVLNQEMRNDSFPHNFTVCLSTMFNFINVLQLVQSIEMFRLLGVTRVVIYKTSCSPDTQRILDYYTHTGLVEVIPWSMSRHMKMSKSWLPQFSPGQMHYYGQIPALNDCVYRYMYQAQYIALQDIDELILPQQVDSWPELLPLLEQKYGADLGYMFRNNVFRSTVSLSPPTSQPHEHAGCCPEWEGVTGINILAHLFHEINNQPGNSFKIIVNPRAVFRTTVHGLLNSKKGCVWVDTNVARMYHTRPPMRKDLTADQLVYDGRLLNYSSRLIPAVNTVLRQTGLIPLDNTE